MRCLMTPTRLAIDHACLLSNAIPMDTVLAISMATIYNKKRASLRLCIVVHDF